MTDIDVNALLNDLVFISIFFIVLILTAGGLFTWMMIKFFTYWSRER